MLLTNSQIIALVGSQTLRVEGALVQVHGRMQSVKLAEGTMMEVIPHDLGLGARMSIALIMSSLTKVAQAFEKVRMDIAKSYEARAKAASERFIPGAPMHDECSLKIQELFAMETDVGSLPKIKLVDLKVDENKLNPMLVVTLMPLLEMPAAA